MKTNVFILQLFKDAYLLGPRISRAFIRKEHRGHSVHEYVQLCDAATIGSQ